MDSGTLVTRAQIESAREFLKRLPANDLVTRGAAWAQIEGDEKPHLYVITPNVEKEGPIEANLRLGKALREYQSGVTDPFRQLDPFAIKLIGPSNPIAREILDWYQFCPDEQDTLYHGSRLAPSLLEPAFFYPAKLFSAPAAPPA